MPHPNLSPQLNALVDDQIPYTSMKVGEILKIHALDAETGKPRTFRIQVVEFHTEEGGQHYPIFQFLRSRFHFFGKDRRTPTRIRAGSLAGAGISATHVPEFVLSMVGLGGIGLGRDYSFEYVGGTQNFAYAAGIAQIERLPCPDGWEVPSKRLSAYLKSVERIRKQEQERNALREKRLERALVIRTQNSVYYLSEVDDDGVRTFKREGDEEAKPARLIGVYVGGTLEVDILEEGQTMHSSRVVSIEPDPDADA